jgi:hypothetical protein
MTYLQNLEAGVETLTDRATSHNVLFTLDPALPGRTAAALGRSS